MKKSKNWKEQWRAMDSVRYIYKEAEKRRGGSILALSMMIDAVFCLVKYGATFHDYIIMRFWMVSASKRKTYLTTKMVQREKKKWNKKAINIIDDKVKFNRFFKNEIGRQWLSIDDSSYEEYELFLNSHKVFFLKPSRESCGFGVRRIMSEQIERTDFYFEIKNHGYLLEEELVLCEEMQRLSPNGTSEIRIVTVTGEGEVNILAAVLRTTNKERINTASDEIFAQIDIDTGKCFANGVDEAGVEYRTHPISGIQFNGFQVPAWSDVLKTCVEAAKKIKDVKVIGWDVAITDNGCFFYEGNPGSGVYAFQMSDMIGKKELFYKYLNG